MRGLAMKASSLNIGDYIRSPRKYNKIYVVKEKRPSNIVLVWRVNPVTKVEQENDFIWIDWDQEVEKVQL